VPAEHSGDLEIHHVGRVVGRSEALGDPEAQVSVVKALEVRALLAQLQEPHRKTPSRDLRVPVEPGGPRLEGGKGQQLLQMSLQEIGLGDEDSRIPMTPPLLELDEVGELLPAVLATPCEMGGDPVQKGRGVVGEEKGELVRLQVGCFHRWSPGIGPKPWFTIPGAPDVL
jgi:hypothetical protein